MKKHLLQYTVLLLALMACVTSCADEPEIAEDPLTSITLINYLGNSQNIHPKVLYFSDGYAGHRFWMAYTPYPNGKVDCENPCIAVSDDGYVWDAPAPGVNPLAKAPKGGYNSDTHLVYNQRDNTLECWWREYDIKRCRDIIVRRISADGMVWGDREVVLGRGEPQLMRLSPAVSIIGGRYVMLYSDGAKMHVMRSRVDAPAIDWDEPTPVNIDIKDFSVWHQDYIVRADGTAAVLMCRYGFGGSNNDADLFIAGIDLDNSCLTSEPTMLIGRSTNPSDITSRSLYRSSIVEVGDLDYIYYSTISADDHRHLDLMVVSRDCAAARGTADPRISSSRLPI